MLQKVFENILDVELYCQMVDLIIRLSSVQHKDPIYRRMEYSALFFHRLDHSMEETYALHYPGEVLERLSEKTEGLICTNSMDDSYETRVSCQGQPISEYDEIKIIDSDGKEVAQGEIGELIVKGPYTIQEYYRLLDNDKYFNEEGFYLSGDKVRKLEDGNLKVVGRVKEQINRAGEKIMPSELEELIIKHPDIMDCAVIGIEDEMLGNKICVYAVARKNISLLDIRKHLEEAGIAMFKLPDVLRLVKRIPVTAMKKVDKEALRILEKEHYE